MWLSVLYLTISLVCCQAFPLLYHPICCNCGSSIAQNAGFRPFFGGQFIMPFMPPQPRIYFKIMRPMNNTEQKEIIQTTTTTPSFEYIQTEEKIIKAPQTEETTQENVIYGPQNQPVQEQAPTTTPIPDETSVKNTIFEIVDSSENAIFGKEEPSPKNSLDGSSPNKDRLLDSE